MDFIEPKASLPEPGSVIAQAPIFFIVSRSRAQRTFCAVVPLARMAAEVSPMLTPIAVTMPGHTRHSSMVGISVSPEPSPPLGSFCSAAVPACSRAIWRSKRSPAIASIPKVANILRRMS
ncbi:unannotated protein [freshwater metagenome]|uniref:Unannotated protein n=1 Tax=freshwater metagenome TaxID=449393 RepID=A0A6J7C5C1_9ZZZZ